MVNISDNQDAESRRLMEANLAAVRKRETQETAPKAAAPKAAAPKAAAPKAASSGSSGGSFGDAFSEARKSGLTTFKWKGGTYGTKMKGETSGSKSASSTPKSSPAPAPRAPAPTREDKEIVVTAKRLPKAGLSTNPIKAIGDSINRAVGSIQSQMDTQSRNMAANRAKNPDLVTQATRALSSGSATKSAPSIPTPLKQQKPPALIASKAAPAPRPVGPYANAPKFSTGTGYGSFKK